MKLKEGTKDNCRVCGRAIEWAQRPVTLDENGEEIRLRYYERRPHWVDVNPPGEDVWNPYCNHENKTVGHQPKSHCPMVMGTGRECYAKVREPTPASDGVELFYCRKHIERALSQYENKLKRSEDQLMETWKSDSLEHLIHELAMEGIKTWALDAVPYYYDKSATRAVNVQHLMEKIWELQVNVAFLTEKLEEAVNASKDKSNSEGQQDLVDLSV